ncbi:uncharacterized protein LOC141854618 [Brevipalpus obovatus]|uniref:uncharacterized protein LOC141854618 n=1 Tax=Brevipalpus obovatus TaxID=246614 RepID=UPI003D9DF9D6
MSQERRFSKRIAAISKQKLLKNNREHVTSITLNQPLILERIFNHLQLLDVYNCRLVCRKWFEEATKFLAKCPAIDDFLVVIKKIDRELEFLRDKGDFECIERLEKKRAKKFRVANEINRSIWELTLLLRGGRPGKVIKRYQVDRLKRFINDTICIPSFSLITNNLTCYYGNHEHSRSFSLVCAKFPTVMLSSTSFNFSEQSELQICETLGSFAEVSDWSARFDECVCTSARVDICGFHINQFSSYPHKVIITDWLKPESKRPDLKDPDFPIVSFIYLTHHEVHVESAIEKFLKGSSFDVTGGRIYGYEARYHDNHIKDFQGTRAISIAFAGPRVKSATWQIELSESLSKEYILKRVERFKRSLKFPINDGKVLGILLGPYNQSFDPFYECVRPITNILSPCIKYINQDCLITYSLRIHLIRI